MQGGRRPTRIATLGALAAILVIAAPALAQFDDFPRAPEPITPGEPARAA